MKLAAYLLEKSIDLPDFAAAVGVSKEAVRLWIAGERTPRAMQMQSIIDATNGAVTPNDFLPTPSPTPAPAPMASLVESSEAAE